MNKMSYARWHGDSDWYIFEECEYDELEVWPSKFVTKSCGGFRLNEKQARQLHEAVGCWLKDLEDERNG